MPITMRETKEAILAMLGASNGLKAQPYGPHPPTLEEYMAPGNYVIAESVEHRVGENPDNAELRRVPPVSRER